MPRVTSTPTALIGPSDIDAAADRIAGRVRPLALAEAAPGAFCPPGSDTTVLLALEFLQYAGTFKARGAANLAAFHQDAGTMPEAGITIASGGNAGLACAWAARATGTRATVFVPVTAPAVKVAKLHEYGAEVRQVGTEYAEALAASVEYAEKTGALLSHAYDNPLIAAGAGTLTRELLAAAPDVDTVVVSVGGGGLFSGTAAAAAIAAADRGLRVLAVEPENCRALNAAIEAGGPVDVTVDSVAADALGARRVSRMAFELANRPYVSSVLVSDADIVAARRALWSTHRLAVEHAAAAALAALTSGVHTPAPGEKIAVILCGANTDPSDLA
ncbi:serine/threonine dehydratase [Streptacidiphilus fuscans]|uniref:Serine/threonine dehydratase n=1 Tax=Streptacidiphilus fuscans TaxID=2789292 RepID=A0A931B9M0_9ACTN|nr:serine/threonine dehydratase [Streptacidiphilus fuscans]MBF9073795.1 serine/threonine dehydratase [Streptacidiphilus fuscans]